MKMMLYATLLLLAIFTSYAGVAAANPSNTANAGKAGLPWPNGNSVDIKQYLQTRKVQWYYTWSPTPVASNIEFVPMLWGRKQVSDWDRTINRTIANQNVTHVLGFNEPDIGSQSMLSPADAATLWQQHIKPLKRTHPNIRLGSPAPSGSPAGKRWLIDFLKACRGCSVDFIALHYYDTSAQAFIAHLEDYHGTFKKPLWVTEWACQSFSGGRQCTQAEVVSFMQQTQEFMDKTAYVERYGWFGAMKNLQGVNTANALMNPQGQINALGKRYIGAAGANVELEIGSMDRLNGLLQALLENAGLPAFPLLFSF